MYHTNLTLIAVKTGVESIGKKEKIYTQTNSAECILIKNFGSIKEIF